MPGRLLSLVERRAPLAAPAAQIALLDRQPLAREFEEALAAAGHWPLQAEAVQVLQVNVGRLCNQTCRHCHVDAGPDRREVMPRDVMEACLDVIDRTAIRTVDITGGAPELHPDFRWFVAQCSARGLHVIDRCNLTILETPAYADLPGLFAAHQVEVVCSLPHYLAGSTDRQRGDGVFDRSIAALRRLNAAGYGEGAPGLRLVLVTNPVGAYLPGGQVSLEREWKRELWRRHGVRFDALYTITNMPISRYLEWLETTGNLEAYLERLVSSFNPATVPGLMCRTLLSVGWDGTLYDCDFNQMLDLPVRPAAVRHVRDFSAALLDRRDIAVARHCFGCTAGSGSSCGGQTTT
jgi:radical SAM/Cys-rich protein